jgi:uncharacterized protein YutE (UPF0331/DUF86 family)
VTRSQVRAAIIADRVSWVRRMLEGLRSLPSDNLDTFLSDPRTIAAAESYVRRGLEALLDLGRHVLAKGFGRAVVEYKDIPLQLREIGVLGEREAGLLRDMAGYRNRLVHFYSEVTPQELFHIRSSRLTDIEDVLSGLLRWLQAHPELMDRP